MANIIENPSEVRVPTSLLQTTELLASDKLVWAALALGAGFVKGKRRLSYTRLANLLGLCRQTVAKAVGRLEGLGWYMAETGLRLANLGGRGVTVPTELVLDTSMKVGARLMHMQLQMQLQFGTQVRPQAQARPQAQPQKGPQAESQARPQAAADARRGKLEFKYASLSEELQRGVKSVKNAVRQLVRASWLTLEQVNRVAPISVTQRNPVRELYRNLQARAERHIARAKFKGEAIMRAILSLLVASEYFMDEAALGSMLNPFTDAALRFDRYYVDGKVAFEFNGTQHYVASKLYSEKEVAGQRERDAIKRELCAKMGITLIVLHSQDLSLTTIRQKIGKLLPLRNLAGAEAAVRALESTCAGYRAKSPEVMPC